MFLLVFASLINVLNVYICFSVELFTLQIVATPFSLLDGSRSVAESIHADGYSRFQSLVLIALISCIGHLQYRNGFSHFYYS